MNCIVLFRHDVERKVRHYWQEWPKRYRELLEELEVETPTSLVL